MSRVGGTTDPVPRAPSGPRRRLRAHLGASPLHLLAHLASLAVCLWALSQVLVGEQGRHVLTWLVGAVLAHDLLLWPLYATLDRVAQAGSALAERGRPLGLVNHVRVPVGLSVLLLAVFFPTILGNAEPNLRRVTGLGLDGYLERWLIACAALFAGSALLYGLRVRKASRSASVIR